MDLEQRRTGVLSPCRGDAPWDVPGNSSRSAALPDETFQRYGSFHMGRIVGDPLHSNNDNK